MTNANLIYSFAKYVNENNPTPFQIGIDYINFTDGSAISENDEYINITEDIRGQKTIDSIGNKYVMKDMGVVVTLKYNKISTQFFNENETLLQKFLENGKEYIDIYDVFTLSKLNSRVELQYNNVSSPITIYNDENTKTMFWIIPIRHTNQTSV